MIKKLVSKALLSVVMDKTARDTLETRKRTAPAPVPAPSADEERESGNDPVADRRTREERRRSLLDSLGDAERRLADKPKLTPERKALIQEMQALQKAKAHLLDELTPEQREKLQVVAMETLNVDPKPSKGRLRPRAKGKKGGR